MVRPKSVHVGQDSRISEIDKCHVDKKAGGVSGMENVEVSVLDPTTIEVWRGICLGVEWGSILSLVLAPSAD